MNLTSPPSTTAAVVSMNNLAVVLMDRGKAQDAGDLFQGALLLLQSLHNHNSGDNHELSSSNTEANKLLQKGMEVFHRCKSLESTILTQPLQTSSSSEFARAISLPLAPVGPSFHTCNDKDGDANASVTTNRFPSEEKSSFQCQLEVAILIFNIAFSVHSREGNRDAEKDLTHSLYTLSYNALFVLFQGSESSPTNSSSFLANDDDDDDDDAFVTKMSELLMSLLWNMGKLCLETNRFAQAKEHYTALATFLHHASATDPPTDSPNTTNHSTTTETTTTTDNDPSDAGNQLDQDARKLLMNAILLAAVHEPEAATAA